MFTNIDIMIDHWQLNFMERRKSRAEVYKINGHSFLLDVVRRIFMKLLTKN